MQPRGRLRRSPGIRKPAAVCRTSRPRPLSAIQLGFSRRWRSPSTSRAGASCGRAGYWLAACSEATAGRFRFSTPRTRAPFSASATGSRATARRPPRSSTRRLRAPSRRSRRTVSTRSTWARTCSRPRAASATSATATGTVPRTATAMATAMATGTPTGTPTAPRGTPRGGEHAREVVAANARLAPRQRMTLALRDLEGRPDDEIALALGAESPSVPALVARARLRLREELALPSTTAGCADAPRRPLRLRRRDAARRAPRGARGASRGVRRLPRRAVRAARGRAALPGPAGARAARRAQRAHGGGTGLGGPPGAALRARRGSAPAPAPVPVLSPAPDARPAALAASTAAVPLATAEAPAAAPAHGGRQTAAAVVMAAIVLIGIVVTLLARDGGDQRPARSSPTAPAVKAPATAAGTSHRPAGTPATRAPAVIAAAGGRGPGLVSPPKPRHLRSGTRVYPHRSLPVRRPVVHAVSSRASTRRTARVRPALPAKRAAPAASEPKPIPAPPSKHKIAVQVVQPVSRPSSATPANATPPGQATTTST